MASEDETDLFRKEFKFFKRRKPPPDLSDVIDFEHLDINHAAVVECVNVGETSSADSVRISGLQPPSEWKVYTMKDYPGFTFIVNPFKAGYQRYWVHRCLHDYPSKPNVCNLDAHMDRADSENIWEAAHHKDGEDKKELLKKLRWVTLGYHYDWNTKKYYADRWSAFPSDLGKLCKYIAEMLGYASFSAEAAIVNFYHHDSTLAGHTDHSEFDLKAPLFSISFGQPAIFLLGGRTKSVRPSAMFVRSGDVIIMADECRLSYHAVPRILSTMDACSLMCFDLSRLQNDQLSETNTSVTNPQTPEVGATCSCSNFKCTQIKPQIVGPSKDENIQSHISEHQHAETSYNCGAVLDSTCKKNCQDYKSDTARSSINDPNEKNDEHFSKKTCCLSQKDKGSFNLQHFVELRENETKRMRIDATNCSCETVELNCKISQTVFDLEWQPYWDYLTSNRINVNVRQVLQPGQSFPAQDDDQSRTPTDACGFVS